MNKKYVSVVTYHTIIKYQFSALIDALIGLSVYNPDMLALAECMSQIDMELEEEGRKLLRRMEGDEKDVD